VLPAKHPMEAIEHKLLVKALGQEVLASPFGEFLV
jgi:hypothetical protein